MKNMKVADHASANSRRVPAALLLCAALSGIWLAPSFAGSSDHPATASIRQTAGTCADPIAIVSSRNDLTAPVVTATDALFVLNVAVALASCEPCVCDVNGSGSVTALDALVTLGIATGQNIPLDCPICGGGTTTTSLCSDQLPENGLNFSVTDDSTGVPGSDVAAEVAQNEEPGDLFTSGAAGDHAPGSAGDNALVIEQSALGLAPTDELDAVSFGPFVAGPYEVLFSLRDSEKVMGLAGTDVRVQSDSEVVPGDIFSSPAVPSGPLGTNVLVADEIELGLHPHDLAADPVDDLDALDLSAFRDPVFFSVARSGGTGGADIWRASGGAAAKLLTASDIGLVDSDEVDALVVQDVDGDGELGGADHILFSVSLDSVGAPGSAVNTQAYFGQAGGDVFVSRGNGVHALVLDESELGLLATDDIDALSLRRGPGDSCSCGDGVLVPPEQCEVGVPCPNPGQICNLANCTCTTPFCEDGVLTPPEQCEPGVIPCPPGQFCTPDCKCVKYKLCPNGVADPGEQCNEPGLVCPPGDFCFAPLCLCLSDLPTYCGDGSIDPGEQCGEPGLSCPDGQKCNLLTCQCLPEEGFRCPDGQLDPGEECELLVDCESPEEYCNIERCECLPWDCTPDGEVTGTERCDPLADPNGCIEGESCNQNCECVLYTPRCGDGAFSPADEDCDFVQIGQMTVEAGCDPGERCDAESCMCEPCIDPDPKGVGVIEHQGFYIPTCQLRTAGADACDGDHWHGEGWGFDQATQSELSFFPDPDAFVCGFGKVADNPEMTFPLGGQLACDLLGIGVSCILF